MNKGKNPVKIVEPRDVGIYGGASNKEGQIIFDCPECNREVEITQKECECGVKFNWKEYINEFIDNTLKDTDRDDSIGHIFNHNHIKLIKQALEKKEQLERELEKYKNIHIGIDVGDLDETALAIAKKTENGEVHIIFNKTFKKGANGSIELKQLVGEDDE
jgi:hypothetical protein